MVQFSLNVKKAVKELTKLMTLYIYINICISFQKGIYKKSIFFTAYLSTTHIYTYIIYSGYCFYFNIYITVYGIFSIFHFIVSIVIITFWCIVIIIFIFIFLKPPVDRC